MSSDGTQGPVEPPMRLELRDMIKDHPDQWTLYLLALERFQAVPEDQPLSYFQIAGIHGRPAMKWPDQKWNRAEGLDLGRGYGGYCTHSSILFLTWHRPYLALFEARCEYIKAARTFRMPYWDWARPELPLFPDEALSRREHVVERPESQKGDTDKFPGKINPLASYKFGEDAAIDQFTAPKLGVKGMNVSERILFLLQGYKGFGAVSNNSEFGNGTTEIPFNDWGSIEDVHNAVHGYIGGGYMGRPPLSAFDPIFWLHHTNIDRLFAIWQACNPGKYVIPKDSTEPTVVRAAGSEETVDSPLTPFAQSVAADGQQKFWTSAGVVDTKTFGYIYPETQSVFNSRKRILNEVDRLYLKRASFANILRSQPGDVETLKQLQQRAKTHLKSEGTAAPELPAGRDIQKLAVGGKYLEWLVNIRAEKAELNGNYIVNIFLGDPDSNTLPLLYVKDHAHVGSFATFGQDENSSCDNCKKGREEKLKITGQIPLTIALVERYLAGQVDSLKPEHITLPTEELKSPEDTKNLLICVVSNEVTFKADNSEVPEYSDVVTSYPEITNDIPESFGTGYDGNNF
ncbi:hypothetical protein BDP81DRAFT_457782 [Colletotrichum phormii]|uniref:tyrosinase n=1 Tax=Colletotrichum phormii TaxID=359342 RepID=A0AAJ0A2A4_9PEZI|nr:uncharacterized protein BDP81DRAFT_457782 [Colletotrichum phormii]KAK1640802.1 hypothetical protein BDP81DRAFT_457782 [Colletotrichum phormii]